MEKMRRRGADRVDQRGLEGEESRGEILRGDIDSREW